MFGCGAVAQFVLSRGSHGTFLTVNFAFGFAATLGIVVSGQISGEDILHAVSLLIFFIIMFLQAPCPFSTANTTYSSP